MIPTALVEFTFVRDHEHAGVEYVAGDKASLPEADAEKLRRLGAGQVTREPASTIRRTKPKRK